MEEIRAMKKAWEDAEPGRAAKAMQSRLNYLNTHLLEEGQGNEGQGNEDAEPGSSPPTSDHDEHPSPKKVLKPVDITPFLRSVELQ